MNKPVASPCISVCYVNDKDLCEGCFRTVAEISEWTAYNDDAKREVLTLCSQRRKEAGWVL